MFRLVKQVEQTTVLGGVATVDNFLYWWILLSNN